MTEKRFELENEDGEIGIIDNIRKKYIFVFVCEDIDMQDGMLGECLNVVNCLNQIWEQTQRFEKHNQELIQRSIQYEDKIDELKNEINMLRTTIARNEAYIERMEHKGEWRK